MEMTGEQRIPAARVDVWRALNDPDILAKCIPGCQSLERTADDTLAATVIAKVGPVKAKFKGNLTLDDIVEPESYTIAGEGSGGVAGFAKGSAAVRLAEDGEDTVLSYSVKAQVGGKLAQIGSRLVDSAARKMADKFFSAFAAEMTAAEEGLLQKAEHMVEDAAHAVEERAHDAEEKLEIAAGRGTFGGAAMWGWIALALTALALLYMTG